MYWFLYDNGLRHERVRKSKILKFEDKILIKNVIILLKNELRVN